ncbi:hypothetical protein COV82_05215 [Candidatus Peregrinibacteria bacterium CG11_big_fil_rev_8_21_14_0_20_46_8]|nr:MAG: hypothetical protein COV82_05215 [Candidatus Peregrinibacteria bacterium CG11_big_fil_rev_8_21_14_0_20_46_8]
MKKTIATFLLLTFALSGCSLFKPDPQTAVNKGLLRLGQAERISSRFSVNGTVTMPPGEKLSRMSFDLTGSGQSDAADPKDIAVDFEYQLGINFDGKGGQVIADVRSLEDVLYFRLREVKLPGENSDALAAQIAPLTNSWFKMPLQEGNPFQALTEEQQALRERFKNTEFFTNAVEDGTDEIRGEEATRYRVELNKDAVKDLIVDLGQTTENAISPEEESAIAESLQDVDFSGAVWVVDKTARRIQGTVTIQPAQGASTSFDIDYEVWDLGKKVAIDAPAEAQEFNPLMVLPLVGALSALTPQLDEEAPLPLEGEPIDLPLGAEQAE